MLSAGKIEVCNIKTGQTSDSSKINTEKSSGKNEDQNEYKKIYGMHVPQK